MQQHFYNIVANSVEYQLSESQEKALKCFADFLCNGSSHSLFILKGYAGTGKTSLISAIVKTLQSFEYNVVLLAPTGRAAKVLASYAQRDAYTIHKNIYRQSGMDQGVEIFDLG